MKLSTDNTVFHLEHNVTLAKYINPFKRLMVIPDSDVKHYVILHY
jgi:hypothetical protein